MTSQHPARTGAQQFEPLFPTPESDDRSGPRHRQFIGILGLVLPMLLWLIAGARPTTELPRWGPLDSVSAYYYSGATAAFVGTLIVLAVYLFIYLGYSNEYESDGLRRTVPQHLYRLRDRITALTASVAATLVAFFPTRAPGGVPVPSWWTPRMETIHYVAALVMFGAFIVFSLFLFPQSKVKHGFRPRDKRVRNGIYKTCGCLMVVCLAWASTTNKIFWPEVLLLEFFAVSWLVKGRADRTVVAVGQRIGHYGRHPRELLNPSPVAATVTDGATQKLEL